MAQDVKHLMVVAALLFGLAGGPLSGRAQPREEAKQPFDYADYAEVLKICVNDKGMVDCRQLKAHPEKLYAYVDAVARVPRSHYRGWDDNTQIAFWLNAYNGLTLKAIIDNYPIKSSFLKSRIYPQNSIRQISGVWDKVKFRVMGQNVTLSHIEHEILRARFNEPRIHVALVCATMLSFVAGHLEGTDRRYILAGDFKVKYRDYDWSLNEQGG